VETSAISLAGNLETVAAGPTIGATMADARSQPPWQPEPADATIGGAPFAPGTLLAGRYRIVRLLGRGGMGVVYHAHDLRLGHPVALKFLPASLARDARRLEQFHNEVRVARQISHPNVCRVYDIGDVDGHLFLSREFIDGEYLSAALRRRGAFPEMEAVDLTRQICAGLDAVHAAGVLHRDLKPANIMLGGSGRAQLMDFGIAVTGDVDDPERITEGTPAYMAPEQLVDRHVTVQSDVYALGLVMYEIFTGGRPFDARTVDELVGQQASITARALPALDGVRPRLRETILRCLERDPSRRPASAGAVAGLLQTVILDAHATWRRKLQVVTQAVMLPILVAAVATGAGGSNAAILLMGACLLLVAVELKYPLGWTASYKGHQIRFYNHPIFGERLYIDGVLADRGRIGISITLRGTIESGAGAGERITAEVRAALPKLSCRIVAESFAAPQRTVNP
jgi:hypothetical protein